MIIDNIFYAHQSGTVLKCYSNAFILKSQALLLGNTDTFYWSMNVVNI